MLYITAFTFCIKKSLFEAIQIENWPRAEESNKNLDHLKWSPKCVFHAPPLFIRNFLLCIVVSKSILIKIIGFYLNLMGRDKKNWRICL